MGRYTGSPDTLVSAGSFAGLCLLQLLWKIPNVVTSGKLGAFFASPSQEILALLLFCWCLGALLWGDLFKMADG